MQINSRQDLVKEYKKRAETMGLRPVVMPDGPYNAQIAIVGEGPGEREVTTGIPFSGGSGAVLWNNLRKICGIGRQDCYSTNVIKRQVSMSAKTNERNNVSKHELVFWKELLLWELQQLPNLKYIIVLGNYALDALCNEKGINSWRGSVVDIQVGNRPVRCLCTINPAFTIREPKTEVLFKFDIAKVKMLLDGTYKHHEIEEFINPTFEQAMDFIKELRNAKKPISLDIETVGMETACIGMANDPHYGMCINFRTFEGNHFSVEQEVRVRRAIQTLSNNPDVSFVAQNGGFDHTWLWYKDRININRVAFDTLLAHHTLYPSLPHNLGALTAQYTTHPYYKDEKDTWREKGDIDKFWRYNVKDCCITYAAMEGLKKELVAQKMDKFFYEHVMRLQPHLVRATVLGVGIDLELKARLSESMSEDVAALRADFERRVIELVEDVDYTVNPNSPAQLRDLLFNRLKLVGRGTSTDAMNRQRIKDHPNTPTAAIEMLNVLDKYKEESKFLSTYVDAKVDPDGRIRCDYKQFGTQSAPGRLSSSKVLWGSGMNLQNQPARAYEMFVADEGCGFAYFDLEQAEARAVGWLAGIQKWIDDFERARIEGGYDCHRALASSMWDIPYNEVPEKDEIDGKKTLRYIAKRCRHGLNYRMQYPRLAETTGLSLHEAANAFHIYHRTNPELVQWWDSCVAEVKETHMLFSPLGRRLLIMERITDDALESIIAFKPQSTIGDWVCSVWYLSEDDPEWPEGCRVAMNIHDALIATGPVEQLPKALSIMKKHAERPMSITDFHGVTRELIIPIEGKLSVAGEDGVHRWSTLEKLK
jgi:uracil-DNA glycosylase family 4